MRNETVFARQNRTAPPSRFNGGGYPTDRHPSDTTWGDIAVWAVIAIAFGCALAGITIWAEVPFGASL